MLTLATLFACPDPPPEIAGTLQDAPTEDVQIPNRGGPEGDPSAMDLSPGGTLLLDISQVVPQKTQEELAASGDAMVKLSGNLNGSCDNGSIRIDVIEVGIEHTDSGPMVGPVTALFLANPGDYTLIAPSGKNYQIAALCDIDNDGKIIQDTDKLAPGIAIGSVTEDSTGINLVFPGDGDTPVEMGGENNGQVQPPGDNTASLPSADAGARDRGEGAPSEQSDASNADTEAEPQPNENADTEAEPQPNDDPSE